MGAARVTAVTYIEIFGIVNLPNTGNFEVGYGGYARNPHTLRNFNVRPEIDTTYAGHNWISI